MEDLDIDVDDFISRIRGNKPPYTCPFDKCLRVCKSFAAIQKHLIQIHKNTKEIEICEIDVVNDENRNCQSVYGNKSPSQIHMKQTSKLISDAVQLSYADSKKFVILQNNKRSFRCNVNVPIYVSTSTVDLNKSAISEINTNTVHDDNSNDTSHSELSNTLRKSCKRRRIVSLKPFRKFRKLNNGGKDLCVNNESLTENSCQEVVKPIFTPTPVFTEDCHMKVFKKPTSKDIEGYARHIEQSLEELNEMVEYDLDEEDLFWLPLCNDYLSSLGNSRCKDKKPKGRTPVKSKKPVIQREVMEYVMDRFEKECHFESVSGNNDDHHNVDEDAVCDVCLDGTCDNSNVILFCDVCNLAVHQECYGVPYVPEGQWLCRKCFHSPSHPVECCLCPNKGGAFKQTDDGRWAHVVCGLWVPEVMFANLIFLEPIENIDKIESARWRLMCYLCKTKNVGACIQCHKSNCYTAFHVTCAQQTGLYMKIEQSERTPGAGGIRKSAFCDMHSPSGYVAGADRGMYANSDDEVSPGKSYKRQKKLKDVRKLLTKRRNSNPPICYPVIPPEKLKEICSNIHVTHKEEFINRIHSYWKLKRECKRGVPLLRRLVASSSKATMSMMQFGEGNNEMITNLKFWQQLRHDLEKARLLSELCRKREKLKREIFRNFVAINDLILHPTLSLMEALIDQLQILDKGKIFAEDVNDDIAPNYSKSIQHPMSFASMRRKLKDFCYITVEKVEADFRLMLNNCQKYNGKNTIYYSAATRLHNESQSIFAYYRQQYTDTGYDADTGLLMNRHIHDVILHSSNDDEIISKLETEINRKVEPAKTESPKSESSNQNSKLSRKSTDSQNSHKDESYTIKTKNRLQDSHNTRSQKAKQQMISSSVGELADSQESSLLRKMPATSSITVNSISSSTRRHSYSAVGNRKSPYARVSSTHTDPDSTFECAVQNQYIQRSSSLILDERDKVNGDDDSNNVFDSFEQSEVDENEDGPYQSVHRFEPLDLVWAKCRGSSWFPGMIIDPYTSCDEVCDKKVSIPVPPDSVLGLVRSHDAVYKYLVCFFDKKRTWQWLEKNKLKPFANKAEIDRKMLQTVRRSKRNKTVQRAYKEAVKHMCQATAEFYPYSDLDSSDEITDPFIAPLYKS